MKEKVVDGAVARKEMSQDSSPMTCFVIMPISDVDGYREGHFREVYDQLIKPAVESSGYACNLATSTNSAHMIQLDIVTRVVSADLCICDLSTNNPNVLFEYGIRQAFDKPTILIKDDRTKGIFDISVFRHIEYDSSLRISNTLSVREKICDAIRDTVAGSNDNEQIFSLVKLMKITKAAMPEGDINQDDARFQLIENKIDALTHLILRAESRKKIEDETRKKIADELRGNKIPLSIRGRGLAVGLMSSDFARESDDDDSE